jgi:hypothetical protein
LLAPFALRPVLPAPAAGRHARDYYEASAPPRGHRSATNLPTPSRWPRAGKGNHEMVPTFTMRSIGQGGTQLYPGSIATPTPQTFNVASPPPEINGFGVETPASQPGISRTAHRPRSTRFEHGFAITGLQPLVRSRCTF